MRIRLDVQCAYDADLQLVNDVLMKVAEDEADICEFPAPRVRVRGFADSGINVQLMGWIENPEDRGRVSHLGFMAIHRAFAENNLEIPYPKRDLHILNQAAAVESETLNTEATTEPAAKVQELPHDAGDSE